MAYSANQSSAIDFDRILRQRQEDVQDAGLRVLPQNRNVKKHTTAKLLKAKYAIIAMCVFAVVMVIIAGYMSLTELTTQNDRIGAQIAEMKSNENALNAKKEQLYNLSYVEDYATTVLGMVKLDKSQINYIELKSPETATLAEKNESSSDFFSKIAKTFNVVLEYLN